MFRIFLYTILIFIIFNTHTSAFHKNGKATIKYGNTDLLKSEYCAGKVKKLEGDFNENGEQGHKITSYHSTKAIENVGILSLSKLLKTGKVDETTKLIDVLKMYCLQDKTMPERPSKFDANMKNLFEIVAIKNDLIKVNGKANINSPIGLKIVEIGIIIEEPNAVIYKPGFLIEIEKKELEVKIKADAAAAAVQVEKKYIEENKPILLEDAQSKLKEYNKIIKVEEDKKNKLISDFNNIKKEFLTTREGIEETIIITANKADETIKEKFKQLLKLKRTYFDSTKIEDLKVGVKKYRQSFSAFKNSSTTKLKKLIVNIKNISKKSQIQAYDKELENIKLIDTSEIKKSFSLISTEVAEFEVAIKDSITLKKEIDRLDAAPGGLRGLLINLSLYLIGFVIFVVIVVFIYLQHRRIKRLSKMSDKAESKFSDMEGQIRSTSARVRAAGSRGRGQASEQQPSQPQPPKSHEDIIKEKYNDLVRDYHEAIDTFSKIAEFKQRWSGVALSRKDRAEGSKTVLVNSARAFEKSEIWCVSFDDKIFAFPGSSVKKDMASYMNMDFERAHRDFKGVFNISTGSSYSTTPCILKRGGAGYVVATVGKIQFPS